jgi:hypothetical protein
LYLNIQHFDNFSPQFEIIFRLFQTIRGCFKRNVVYQDPGAEIYEALRQQHEVASLNRRAAKLGFDLVTQLLVVIR